MNAGTDIGHQQKFGNHRAVIFEREDVARNLDALPVQILDQGRVAHLEYLVVGLGLRDQRVDVDAIGF